MTILPPLLPELDGGRPAAVSLGSATATIRLGARVVGIAGVDALIETAHGRALLQGAPGLRPGAALVLELQRADPALARTGRGDDRSMRSDSSPACRYACSPRRRRDCPDGARATALEVNVRPVGPDGRAIAPALIVRLSVPPPEPGSGSPGAARFCPRAGRLSRQRPARDERPGQPGGAHQHWHRTGVESAGGGAGLAHRAGTGDRVDQLAAAPPAILDHLGALAAQGRALEAVVLPRDALGRTLLRAAGLTLQVDTPLDLPAGARCS